MAVDSGFTTITIVDSAAKKTTTNVNSDIPTAGNYVALLAARDKYISLVEDLIEGRILTSNFGVHKNFQNGLPSSENAQRSKKFVIHMIDSTTGEPYHHTIGTAKDFDGTDLKRAGNTNEVDITTAWWTDAGENGSLGVSRVAAIEGFARSPESNHAGTVSQIFLQD